MVDLKSDFSAMFKETKTYSNFRENLAADIFMKFLDENKIFVNSSQAESIAKSAVIYADSLIKELTKEVEQYEFI